MNADAEIWFDCNGAPLKWHYPIGRFFSARPGGMFFLSAFVVVVFGILLYILLLNGTATVEYELLCA